MEADTRTDERAPPATLDFASLRGALDEIPFGVATLRGNTLFYANEALSRILGAPPGGLEHKPLASLFEPGNFAVIAQSLAQARVFSGRVRALTFGGGGIDVDVHLESYRSGAQGHGGFLVVRDVSLELGSLGRLVDTLGGALFRIGVERGTLEMVSPAITQITGISADICAQRPVLLTSIVSSEERERVTFLYRRLARGELPTATAQVSLRRLDGAARLVRIVATPRRDGSGQVRHIDGVVLDAALDHIAPPPRHDAPACEARDPAARAVMDLTFELLREASPHHHAALREVKALRSLIDAESAALRPEARAEILSRLDALAAATQGAAALGRGVRHALSRSTMGATLGEIFEGVCATLAPTLGKRAVSADAGDAASIVFSDHVDELGLALTHLALRAFRFAGSGTLRLVAHRVPAPLPDVRAVARGLRRGPEREHAIVEILATAPADLADAAMEISSDVLRAVPRPDEADLAYSASQALIAAASGTIDSDDAGFASARTVIRLKGA